MTTNNAKFQSHTWFTDKQRKQKLTDFTKDQKKKQKKNTYLKLSNL